MCACVNVYKDGFNLYMCVYIHIYICACLCIVAGSGIRNVILRCVCANIYIDEFNLSI